VAKANLKFWFWVILLGDAKVPPVSLVTVCGASVVLSHTTCVPTLTLSDAGSKEYFSFFSTIFTITVAAGAEVGAVVAVGVGAVVAVGVGVAAGDPPHAAKRKAATAVNDMTFQNQRVLLAKDNRFVFTKNPPYVSSVLHYTSDQSVKHSIEDYDQRLQKIGEPAATLFLHHFHLNDPYALWHLAKGQTADSCSMDGGRDCLR
jgi:hypothetical protein